MKGVLVEHGSVGWLAFWAVLLAAGIVSGGIARRMNQPPVLGYLGAGIMLSALEYAGIGWVDSIRHDGTIGHVSELGAILLLFLVGLESNVKDMAKVGVNSLLVAFIGAAIPFAVGWLVLGPMFFPDEPLEAHLFLGSALVATSVGITALVLKDLKLATTLAATIVLGAAVIDDVIGLLVLAVVEPIAGGEEITTGFVVILCAKALAFLGASVAAGMVLAGPISRLLARVHSGEEMKIGMAFTFALGYAYLGYELVGLAPIVGAFAAGLVLDAVHFSEFEKPEVAQKLRGILGLRIFADEPELARAIHEHEHGHVEDVMKKVSILVVPIFFVYTGLQIDFASLLQVSLYPVALIISVVAIAGKVVAGIAGKGSITERLLIGVSMVPRGEVGLIFASVGLSAGAVEGEMFSTILLVVVVTTFVAPFLIKAVGARYLREQGAMDSFAEPKKQFVH